jgi:phosphatidylinositol alpha-mannosyltransferase
VCLERFQPNGSSLAGRFGAHKKNILYVGQFVKKKGFGVLLEAFKVLARERGDVRLLAVGDGPLERTYRRAKIPDVHFLGHKRGKSLAACYEISDVFVAPSVGFESFGIILLEAMAAGLPIVATEIPGFLNVVADDREALLVPPNDPDRMASAIGRVLDDPELARSLRSAGAVTVKGYSWERVADQVESVYRDVTGIEAPKERLVAR